MQPPKKFSLELQFNQIIGSYFINRVFFFTLRTVLFVAYSGRQGVQVDLMWQQPVFFYNLRHVVGFGLVDMAPLTNPKPTIYRNLCENTGTGQYHNVWSKLNDGLLFVCVRRV